MYISLLGDMSQNHTSQTVWYRKIRSSSLEPLNILGYMVLMKIIQQGLGEPPWTTLFQPT